MLKQCRVISKVNANSVTETHDMFAVKLCFSLLWAKLKWRIHKEVGGGTSNADIVQRDVHQWPAVRLSKSDKAVMANLRAVRLHWLLYHPSGRQTYTGPGDHSGCDKPPVDSKTKLRFSYIGLILKCNFCFGVNGRFGTTWMGTWYRLDKPGNLKEAPC